ncbi:DMT family transporter [Roseateles asaccharophilus]|uniref:Drug/metabolite transporter (DMT)-like permease n=1 Tax=Roseateles asaccharophilus TaxID=582607 RepID=A0ABU2A5B2_9BURK|nr:DMT family transporter [Roseateles asaccharophilus]MDR7332381.1 drug/metabolite transporter (DMT)-like permease [Roseateles asaccharophilus]
MSQLTPRLALLLTLPPLLWAGNAVVGRVVRHDIPPMTLNALRWGLAFVLLAPLARRLLLNPREAWTRWRGLAWLGFLGMGCYNALQYLALHTSSPLNVTLITASMPVWMLGVGAVFYEVKPTHRQFAGAALSLLGVALVIARGDPAALLAVRFVPGDLLMLLAIFTWAIYSWMLARPGPGLRAGEKPDWNWAEALMAQLMFGVVFSNMSAGVEQALAPAAIQWSPALLAALVYVAVGPSLIAYRCWGLGVSQAGPALAGFFVNLTPVFAAIISAALLGEAPAWYHGTAFLLIAAGIVVSSRG